MYVYLFSNFDALRYYGKPNKIGNFKNKLACYLPINDSWQVALTEFVYTKSWYNVQNKHKITLTDEFGTVLEFKDDEIVINPGCYETPDSLVNELNKQFKKFKIIETPELTYNSKENYVYLKNGKTDNLTVVPNLGEEIENILGLRNRNLHLYEYTLAPRDGTKYLFYNLDVFEEDILKGFHPVEINAGIHYLCVYCDIVDESFTGDTKSQLLRLVEIPKKTKFGDTVHIRYNDRNYKEIQTNRFQSIEISVRDSSNQIIPFNSGQCTAVLHFKQII